MLGLTLIAKFLAFGRELAVAAYFGSTADTDSFFIANGLIANILYGLTTAFATVFLPVYIHEKEKNGMEAARVFSGKSIFFFFILSLAVTGILCVSADWLTGVIAPGVAPAQYQQIVFFIRILSVGLIFSLLNSFACSLLDAERIYGFTAASGILYSASVIASAVFFSRKYGITALVGGVAGAYLLQFAVSGWRSRKFISLSFSGFQDKRLWNMALIALPILLSNTTVEINQVVNRMLALKLGKGVVSAFSYASTLTQFVTSTLIYSLVTIFFTEFSKAACAENAVGKIKDLLRIALKILLLILLPLTLITVIFAEDIVYIALKRGRFTVEDVCMTATGLRWFAPGFAGIVCKALFIKCFIAMKDTRTPMTVSIGEVALNILLAFLLYQHFGIAGLTVSLAAANISAAFILLWLLCRKLQGNVFAGSWIYMVKILLCVIASTAGLLFWDRISSSWSVWLRFPLAVIAGFVVFLPVYRNLLQTYFRNRTSAM